MKKIFILLSFIFLLSSVSQSQLLFQADSIPITFGPDIISDGYGNRDMAISPKGDWFLYTLQFRGGSYSAILQVKKINGKWSAPEVAWFSGKYNDMEPSFSPDGERIYFASNRPVTANEAKHSYDIWYMDKKGSGWSEPLNAGTGINTDKDEFYPCITNAGNLYFTRDNDSTSDDIFVAKKASGGFDTAHALGSAVNSVKEDFNAYVDPEEKFIIFSSYKRPDDLGGGDLYVSIKENGEWKPSKNLGKLINSKTIDYSPYVSPDHKYFFFTSRRFGLKFPFSQPKNLEEIHKYLSSNGNGDDDIYIMRFVDLEKAMFK